MPHPELRRRACGDESSSSYSVALRQRARLMLAANRSPERYLASGFLWHAASPEQEALYLAPLRQGLADVGYIEGQNVTVEHRFPAEMADRMKSMAEELVRLNMDVLVGAGPTASLALQKATRTIPIVFVAAYDPLGSGLVKSYSRPTENITGIAFPDLLGKRLEILKEALPQLSRVVVLMHTTDESRTRRYIASVEGEAHKLGLLVEAVQFRQPPIWKSLLLQL
jgi:putative ABC transport system substrate-binding protein